MGTYSKNTRQQLSRGYRGRRIEQLQRETFTSITRMFSTTARGLSAILSAVWLSQQGLATPRHKKARTDRWSKSRYRWVEKWGGRWSSMFQARDLSSNSTLATQVQIVPSGHHLLLCSIQCTKRGAFIHRPNENCGLNEKVGPMNESKRLWRL